MTSTGAMATCEQVLSILKKSGLNFIISETPFSAYLTIRKTFYKGFKHPTEKDKGDLKKLEIENINLKNELEETVLNFENLKQENLVLKQRLQNAEKEIIKQSTGSKLAEARLAQEVTSIKQTNKKCNEEISELTAEISKDEKKIKSLEKIISKLEVKNKNITEQFENFKTDKNNNKKENEKLVKELKILKDKDSKAKQVNSVSTQTEVLLVPASSKAPDRMEKSVKTVNCLICSETFKTAKEFGDHSKTEHDILINLGILEDTTEEDDFTRMLKCMVVDSNYLKERVKYYPEHWDNIDLRIKIRMIAKMKFEEISRQIDKSMENNSSMKTSHKGNSIEV